MMIKCAFCSYEFDENAAQKSCGKCFKLGKCTMVKCPRCGYEFPPTPEWLKKIGEKFGKKEEKQ